MTSQLETLPDRSGELTFASPTSECVGMLLQTGAVVIDPVVPEIELEGVREAVDTLYFESLHKRVLYKVLEQAPILRIRDRAHHNHSRTSQFDPNSIPARLSGATDAIDRIRRLDDDFFLDERLRSRYANRHARLNIADVSRSRPGQKAFVDHQDSIDVTRVGYVLQPEDTCWTIRAGEAPSRQDHDYSFTAPRGSVVAILQRAGERPRDLAPGQGSEYYVEDGSEVHSGDNLTANIRHRLAVFAEEKLYEPSHIETIRDAIVTRVVARLGSHT